MTSSDFSSDWIKQFSDPYAILGVSVTADERRISKRYRQVAKRLHPDQQMNEEESVRAFANHVLTRLVNPSYQRLKQDKGRAETLATLRFKVRRLSREQQLVAQGELSKQLIDANDPEVEVFYEKALAELSENQYDSIESFAERTTAIAELNLIYLRRKMGETVIREKRTGLVSAKSSVQAAGTTAAPGQPAPDAAKAGEFPQTNYAQRHVVRAKTYIASKCYPEAIQELRDAVRIEPSNSNYHAMLGQAYLLQSMIGMAKVHIRQALKLDPKNTVARKYANQLDIDLSKVVSSEQPASNGHRKSGGLLRFFTQKRAVE
jgi:curved DNA-binding protein CbpA